MSDIVVTLNNKTQPIPINYARNNYGYSDFNNNTNKYLFQLFIYGKNIGKKYFRNLEDNKYSHLIDLYHKINLADIEFYKVSVSTFPSELPTIYNLNGKINQNESSSTQRNDNLYIEFTQNDNGFTICSCFYIGMDHNKIFVSPPN